MGYRQFLDKKFTLALMILLILSGLLSSCSASPTATQEPSDDQVLALVQEVSASGEVVPIQWVTLSYPTGADQLELRVSKGDQVSKDAILVKNIDHRLMASLNQAQAALARAQLAYDQTINAPNEQAIANADSAYLNAYANLIRQEDINADESLVEAAQADVDAAYLNLLTTFEGASDQEIAAAGYDLKAAELAVAQAEAALDIKAPFDGTVVEVLVNAGEPISAY
jgi:multidrug efflux pump subunit AcrA (membrane-fusion protein)